MWLGLVVLLIFAVWAFADYDFVLVVSALATVDVPWILVGVLLNIALLYLRVFKWRFFHRSFRDCSFLNMSLAAFAAYTCNMVVPAKVGIFVQAWLLNKKECVPVGTVLSTLVLVRVMDGLSLSVIGVLVFTLVDVSSDQSLLWGAYKTAGVLLASFLFFVVALLFLFLKYQNARDVLKHFVIRIVPKRFRRAVENFFATLWEGFTVLNHGANLGIIALLSVVFWALAATMAFAYLTAFHLGGLPFYVPLCLILAQALGFLIPSPGYVGPFHAATVAALSFFSVAGELALSVAIVMHAALFVTNSLPGIIYLWIEKLNISQIITQAKKDIDPAPRKDDG